MRIQHSVVRLLLTAVASLSTGACSPSPEHSDNVLLVTWDTTRADVLGCYGGAQAVSPNLDRLADQGMVFETVFTPTPLTLPAHASIFTGLYPYSHGIRDNALFELPEHMDTLAESLKSAGYSTAAFVASFVLDGRFGLNQGFDVYDDQWQPDASKVYVEERPGRAVTDAALAWLEQDRSKPFFLWVHYYDPHFPYQPDPEFAVRFPDQPYVAEVAMIDHELGRLLRFLERTGQFASTLICVTADHGEALGDHGEKTHGYFLYQSTVRVPLVFSHADLRRGEIRSEPASLVDVAPTILDFLELDRMPTEGRSLWHSAGARPLLYLESELPRIAFGYQPIAGLTDGTFKLIDMPHPELYDLNQDPDEQRNRFVPGDRLATQMQTRLRALRAKEVDSSVSGAAAEHNEKLAALGYLGGQPDKSVSQTGWTVLELQQVIALRDQARSHLVASHYQQCIETANELIALAPECAQGYSYAGTALARIGEYAKARDRLLQAVNIHHALPEEHWNLATCYQRLGELELALAEARTVIDLDPRHTAARRILAAMALQNGAEDDARRHLRKLIEYDPDSEAGRWAATTLQQLQ